MQKASKFTGRALSSCNFCFCIAASSILRNMNSSVDPCEDFYEFVCGGWKANNRVPPTRDSWNRFMEVEEHQNQKLKGKNLKIRFNFLRLVQSRSSPNREERLDCTYCRWKSVIPVIFVRKILLLRRENKITIDNLFFIPWEINSCSSLPILVFPSGVQYLYALWSSLSANELSKNSV